MFITRSWNFSPKCELSCRITFLVEVICVYAIFEKYYKQPFLIFFNLTGYPVELAQGCYVIDVTVMVTSPGLVSGLRGQMCEGQKRSKALRHRGFFPLEDHRKITSIGSNFAARCFIFSRTIMFAKFSVWNVGFLLVHVRTLFTGRWTEM